MGAVSIPLLGWEKSPLFRFVGIRNEIEEKPDMTFFFSFSLLGPRIRISLGVPTRIGRTGHSTMRTNTLIRFPQSMFTFSRKLLAGNYMLRS